MRIFGYALEAGDDSPLELQEASLQATPHELRWLAAFLNEVAQSMEEHGEDFGHEHFRDYCKRRGLDAIDGTVDLIVAK